MVGCKFCAFYRRKGSPGAYVLSVDEIMRKIRDAAKLGATQILLQGGLNPDLSLEYFEEVLTRARKKFPRIQRHFFSPGEIYFMAKVSGNSIKETLKRLIDAGLQSLPGGGAEILVDRLRKKISPGKIDWKNWKNVVITAHALGLPATATMVFGLSETNKERVEHILKIREIQKKTKGFTAFIPWSFQPGSTKLGKEGYPKSTGTDYLKIVAVSRILLHGAIKNIQASWVTQGANVAQIALMYGANDFGGTMIEENVVKAAGAESKYMPPSDIVRLVKEIGRPVAQRNTLYQILKRY
jgi:cyclic dehypoxanthinyl futalosine synthase